MLFSINWKKERKLIKGRVKEEDAIKKILGWLVIFVISKYLLSQSICSREFFKW